MDEKLRWIFNLYDLNRDGKVTKDELQLIVTSIYELMGKYTSPPIEDMTPKQHAEIVFKVCFHFLLLTPNLQIKLYKIFYLRL